MRTPVLLLVCFAHACHARRVQAMAQDSQGSSYFDVQESQEFVNLLFSLKPEVSFNIAAPGSRFHGHPTRTTMETLPLAPAVSMPRSSVAARMMASEYLGMDPSPDSSTGSSNNTMSRSNTSTIVGTNTSLGSSTGSSNSTKDLSNTPTIELQYPGGEVGGGPPKAQKKRIDNPPPLNTGLGSSTGSSSSIMQQGGEMARQASSPRSNRALDGITVQGGSLKTWSFPTPFIERVQVDLKTEGRPLNADIELWQGPDNTPQKMAVYSEDGQARPVRFVMETPNGQHSLRMRNSGTLEYPFKAIAETNNEGFIGERPVNPSNSQLVQGGAIKTHTFEPTVGSVAVLMQTDGRPLNARIELLQGPNNIKQLVDLYSENGLIRPFYAIMQTPGSGHILRIVNTATMEYPLMCSVEQYEVENFEYQQGPLSADGFFQPGPMS